MQTVSDFMTDHVWTVKTTSTIREAARIMADHDVGFLPVLHEETSAGVVTDRDILVRVVAQNLDPDTTYVGTILSTDTPPRQGGGTDMNAAIASLPIDTPIDQAVHYMDERHFRRVAVHDHDYRLVGVLSRSDLPDAKTLV